MILNLVTQFSVFIRVYIVNESKKILMFINDYHDTGCHSAKFILFILEKNLDIVKLCKKIFFPVVYKFYNCELSFQ